MADPLLINQLLEQLAPGDPALQAAFRADAALMDSLDDYLEVRVKVAQHDEARKDYDAPEPNRKSGDWWRGTETQNPDWTEWDRKRRAAAKVLAPYYDRGLPTRDPTPALKELKSDENRFQTRLNTAYSRVQTAYKREQGDQPSATNPPDIVWLPTGTQGEERAHVYDEATKKYVPATDAAGNPIPTRRAANQPAPRVAEGTQSWEPKELTLPDGRKQWYQVPIRARADGSWEPDTSRTPQPMTGMPSGGAEVTVLDGVPHTRTGPDGGFVPVPGYVKPPMFRTDAQGRGYTSTDNGKTWQPATGLPGTPQTISVDGTVYPLDENGLPLVDRGVRLPPGEKTDIQDGYLIRVKPDNTVERIDLYTPEQRGRFDETNQLNLETARTQLEIAKANAARANALADPMAEYQRQVQLAQQTATTYRDDLNEKVLRGELSVEDASAQFDTWWDANVEARLSPYQTMAQGAYRREQNEYQRAQAAEQARVDAINREREAVAFGASEKARQDLLALAPRGGSPEFLQQFAQNVANIGKPLPGGPSQHHGGMVFSPESLSLDAVKRSQPSLDAVGQQAAARALAQISPAAAQQVGVPPPQVPSLPQFQRFMNAAPFSIPNPALPLRGSEALDLGNPAIAGRLGVPVQPGTAMTVYQGGRREPWQIPA